MEKLKQHGYRLFLKGFICKICLGPINIRRVCESKLGRRERLLWLLSNSFLMLKPILIIYIFYKLYPFHLNILMNFKNNLKFSLHVLNFFISGRSLVAPPPTITYFFILFPVFPRCIHFFKMFDYFKHCLFGLLIILSLLSNSFTSAFIFFIPFSYLGIFCKFLNFLNLIIFSFIFILWHFKMEAFMTM